ncbi:MAG: hypothetical protein DME48_03055 [Verrucomicrobia bacterium]|nr:MAG: hypothetical protein DME48_03055 [Verrucomicrobiota bacterium]
MTSLILTMSTLVPGLSYHIPRHNKGIVGRHEVEFYSDDRHLLDDLTQFVGAALKVGNAAIVVATESHRDSLLSRLQACEIDIGAAVEFRRLPSSSCAVFETRRKQ